MSSQGILLDTFRPYFWVLRGLGPQTRAEPPHYPQHLVPLGEGYDKSSNNKGVAKIYGDTGPAQVFFLIFFTGRQFFFGFFFTGR